MCLKMHLMTGKYHFRLFFLKACISSGIWNRENKAIFITFSKNVYGGFRLFIVCYHGQVVAKKTLRKQVTLLKWASVYWEM